MMIFSGHHVIENSLFGQIYVNPKKHIFIEPIGKDYCLLSGLFLNEKIFAYL
jgi:hypothetical protein